MKIKILLYLMFLAPFICFAQQNGGGTPITFTQDYIDLYLSDEGNSQALNIANYTLPIIDNAAEKNRADSIKASMCSTCKNGYYGKMLPVDIDLITQSTVKYLSDSSKLFLMKVSSGSAYGMQFYFDKFQLPDSGRLFFYNSEHTMILGHFSSFNNRLDSSFGVQNINGDTILIEYFEPKNVAFSAKLHINKIVHIFASIFDKSGPWVDTNDGPSGPCEINVSCSNDWAYESSSVALILIPNEDPSNNNYVGWCSGALINDVASDGHPYFLTAAHCYPATYDHNNADGSVTEVTQDLKDWIFIFNYDDPNCSGDGSTVNSSLAHSLTGATLLKIDQSNTSDYLLLDLSLGITSPATAKSTFSDWHVCYSGWDRSNTVLAPSPPYKGIHHPHGDVKKISTSETQATITSFRNGQSTGLDHWNVVWSEGVTEQISSGSPLYNTDHRIIGQLHGGRSSCSISTSPLGTQYGPLEPDYYGIFATSWFNGDFAHWLDPQNTGATSISRYCPTIQTGNGSAPSGGGSTPGTITYQATPDVIMDLNGHLEEQITLCQGDNPIIYVQNNIVQSYQDLSGNIYYILNTGILKNDNYPVSCSAPHNDKTCFFWDCWCTTTVQQFYLMVYKGCDPYFSCAQQIGGWYNYDVNANNDHVLSTIDVSAYTGVQFEPGNYYIIILAENHPFYPEISGTSNPHDAEANIPANGGWHQGVKYIYMAPYNVDLTTQVQGDYTAASHITMNDNNITGVLNAEAGVQVHIEQGSHIHSGSKFHGWIDPNTLPCYDGHRLANTTDTTNKPTPKLSSSPNETITYISPPSRDDGFIPPGISKQYKSKTGFIYNLKLAPNPTNSKLAISYNTNDNDVVSIAIYSSIGVKVATLFENKNYSKGQNIFDYDVSMLENGMYFVEITNKDGANLLKLNVIK